MRRSNPVWTPAMIAMAATAGVGVASFGAGTYVRFRRAKKTRARMFVINRSALQMLRQTKTKGFKIPKLKGKQNTYGYRLSEYLRAFLALAELYAVEAKSNVYMEAIHRPASAYPPDTYGREHGPRLPGLLYSTLPPWLGGDAIYAKQMWDAQPAITMIRAQGLLDFAMERGLYLAKQGQVLSTGDGGNGPTIGELAEDYAQDAAVTYLAAAIPGGALILGIAEAVGFGWTNTSGRQEVPKGEAIPNDRYRALESASDLLRHVEANPAPASSYPDGKLP